MKNNLQMLYIHIPFCTRKCYYCGFVSVNKTCLWKKYFQTLIAEIKSKKNNNNVSSIYFGGGTPSIVDVNYIEQVMDCIKQNYNILDNAEITLEANPTSDFVNNIERYKRIGINRISFGVQSLDNNNLLKLGRDQPTNEAICCIENTCKMLDNVSCDLLLGLENQNFYQIKNDIDILNKVGVKHLSVYMLMIEENTMLYNMVKDKMYKPLNDDQSVQLYQDTYQYLKSLGFERYEISNFCKPNFYSRHNLGYWQMKNYLGFGASAHSFYDNIRSCNSDNIEEYINDNKTEYEKLSQEQIYEEQLMLGLRTKYGVEEKIIKNKTVLKQLLNNGFVKKVNNNIVITDDNFNITNQIILKLI